MLMPVNSPKDKWIVGVKGNQYGVAVQHIKPGVILSFRYLFNKNPAMPYPLLLVSRVYSDGKVAGVNLKYLNVASIKQMVENFCGNNFSYQSIKGNEYLVSAYRCYKKMGIKQAKVIDCGFLSKVIGIAKSYDPNELEAMRKEIQKQINTFIQAKEAQATQERQNEIGEILTEPETSITPTVATVPTIEPNIPMGEE